VAHLDRIQLSFSIVTISTGYEPGTHYNLYSKILYMYLTIKSLKNPNPLTTIPAHQPQHHHDQLLFIITFLTSFTLNRSKETCNTSHGTVPKLTEAYFSIWKQKIHQVLIAKKAFNTVTSVKFLPPGNFVAICALQDIWHDRAKKAITSIHLGCCDELHPLIANIIDSVEM
jgi:hypothetical protein